MNTPESLVLLGVPVHRLTAAEALAGIDDMIRRGRPAFLSFLEFSDLAAAIAEVETQRVYLDSDLVLCASPLVRWAAARLNAPIPELLTREQFLPRLAKHCMAGGYRLFLLGAPSADLDAALAEIKQKHPRLRIAGSKTMPWPPDETEQRALQEIHAARPDLLLAIGPPDAWSAWVASHSVACGVPCAFAAGPNLRAFLAEERPPLTHPPAAQPFLAEPKAVFRREYRELMAYVKRVETLRTNRRRAAVAPAPPISATTRATKAWAGQIDIERIVSGEVPVFSLAELSGPAVLDLSGVEFMDSSALGALLAMNRESRKAGGQLTLFRPSQPVREMFQTLNLERALSWVDDPDALPAPSADSATRTSRLIPERTLLLSIAEDITSENAGALREWAEREWAQFPGCVELQLDLGRVGFVDSSGLGLLIALLKMAEARRGGLLNIARIEPSVAEVIHLARMGERFGLASPSKN